MNLREVQLINVFSDQLSSLKQVRSVVARTYYQWGSSKIISYYVVITFTAFKSYAFYNQLILRIDHQSMTLSSVELARTEGPYSRITVRSAPYPLGGLEICHHTAEIISQLSELAHQFYLMGSFNSSQFSCAAKILVDEYDFFKD